MNKTKEKRNIWGETRYFQPSIRYEYKCPRCNHVNIRYDRCGRIVCSKCGNEF